MLGRENKKPEDWAQMDEGLDLRGEGKALEKYNKKE